MPNKLRLLALDGGGVRGLSTLMILRQLMEAVDLDSPPKPCDYFDMIGGTSTGGLIAIMLGRLKMSIEECIDAYLKLSDRIFQKKRHRVTVKGKIQGRFDSDELEQAVKEIIAKQGLQEDVLLKDAFDAACKVFVCATSKETSETVCLTSYKSPRGNSDLLNSVKMWEACRATSAASSFFDPIAIGRYKEEFVDGAIGANNPVVELWNQAQLMWGPELLESKVQCLVSIGTGIPSIRPFQDDILHIGETLVAITTETEQTAERFRRDKAYLDSSSRYFRFNVARGLEDIGLEKSTKIKEIAAATRQYIQCQEVYKQMQACAAHLAGTDCHALGKFSSAPPFIDKEREDVMTWIYARYCHESVQRGIKVRSKVGTPWILNHPQYLDWLCRRPPHNFLWVHGIPGSGKTVLAASIIEHITSTTNKTACIYFLCDRQDNSKRRGEDIKKSFLAQILSTQILLPESVVAVYKTSKARGEKNISNGEVEDLLHQVTAQSTTLFVILDAADECEDSSEVVDFLMQQQSRNPSIKTIMLSRDEFNIRNMLERGLQERLSKLPMDSRQDINIFLQAELSKSFEDKTQVDRLLQTVERRSNGSFLYATLTVRALQASPSENDIENQLNALPETLQQRYLLCYSRSTGSNMPYRQLTYLVFCWAVCATRPMRWTDLQTALAIDENACFSDKAMPRRSIVLELCSPLVEFQGPEDTLHCVHLTVAEFFRHMDNGSWYLKAQRVLASKCLAYLSFCSPLKWKTFDEKKPFLAYATENWHVHAQETKDVQALAKDEHMTACISRTQGLFRVEELYTGGDSALRLKVRRQLLGDHHPDTIRNWVDVAFSTKARSPQKSSAIPIYEEALKAAEKCIAPPSRALHDLWYSLGELYRQQNRLADEDALYRAVWNLLDRITNMQKRQTHQLDLMNRYSSLQAANGAVKEAFNLRWHVFDEYKKRYGWHSETQFVLESVVGHLVEMGQVENAKSLYKSAYQDCLSNDDYDEKVGMMHSQDLAVRFSRFCNKHGYSEEAERYLTDALDSVEALLKGFASDLYNKEELNDDGDEVGTMSWFPTHMSLVISYAKHFFIDRNAEGDWQRVGEIYRTFTPLLDQTLGTSSYYTIEQAVSLVQWHLDDVDTDSAKNVVERYLLRCGKRTFSLVIFDIEDLSFLHFLFQLSCRSSVIWAVDFTFALLAQLHLQGNDSITVPELFARALDLRSNYPVGETENTEMLPRSQSCLGLIIRLPLRVTVAGYFFAKGDSERAENVLADMKSASVDLGTLMESLDQTMVETTDISWREAGKPVSLRKLLEQAQELTAKFKICSCGQCL